MRSQPFFFLSILLIALLFVDLYVFKGIKLLVSQSSSKYIRWVSYGLFWLFSILLYVGIISVMANLTSERNDALMRWATFIFGLFVLSFVPKLIFAIFHLIDDLSFIGKKAVHQVMQPNDAKPITRYDFITKIGVVVAAVPFASIIYGMVKGKYDFEVIHQPIRLAKLPPNFKNLKIVHISDMHIGSFNHAYDQVQKGIDLINALKPDLVFFTGDLVNNYADETSGWEKVLSSIESKYGKYSILGNHDYGDYVAWDSPAIKAQNLQNLKDFHKKIGFTLLLNENRKIQIGEEYIQLIGVENWGTGGFAQYGKLKKALENTRQDECKILLSHDPSHWEAEVIHESDVDLMLAGHTHGMQFGIRLGSFKYSPVQHRYKQWSGLYKEKNHQLYVNKGFGFLGFPGRVGMPPEITCITLLNA